MTRLTLFPALLAWASLAAEAPGPLPAQAISLQEAIRTALQNNLQVAIAQEVRETARAGVADREGAFDWKLNLDAKTGREESGGLQQGLEGPAVQGKSVTHERSLSGELHKGFQWGGALRFKYEPYYRTSTGPDPGSPVGLPGSPGGGGPYGPYRGSLGASYTQNLLQGFGRQGEATVDLVVARNSAEAADHTFQEAVIKLAQNTETHYWDLVFAGRNLANKRTALELARKLLEANTIQVRVGTLAPIEVISAEAEVAKKEQDIITSEANLLNAQDTLFRDLHPEAPGPVTLEPTDDPVLDHPSPDEAAAIRMALRRRVELQKARIDREIAQVRSTAAADGVRPQLDARVGYRGGSDGHGSLGPVNSDLAGLKRPGYEVGLHFSVPLQNRTAKAKRAAARANLNAAGLTLRDQEQAVTLEVRMALRNLEERAKGIKASAKTRLFRERSLEVERKKYQNGMSTNFLVLEAMTQLDKARDEELAAQIGHAKAITALEVAVGNLLAARNFIIR